MNTGIQDLYNLAWKMALVLKGQAPKSLLESYEAERVPVGADVVARTRAQSERIGRTEGQQDRLVDTQILITYRNSKWAKESLTQSLPDLAPRAGDRHRIVMGCEWRMFILRFGCLISFAAQALSFLSITRIRFNLKRFPSWRGWPPACDPDRVR
jgi:hypothetical protein